MKAFSLPTTGTSRFSVMTCTHDLLIVLAPLQLNDHFIFILIKNFLTLIIIVIISINLFMKYILTKHFFEFVDVNTARVPNKFTYRVFFSYFFKKITKFIEKSTNIYDTKFLSNDTTSNVLSND